MNHNNITLDSDGMLHIPPSDNFDPTPYEYHNPFEDKSKTPLCVAISNSNYSDLETLLKSGSDPYIEDALGITPICLAISTSNYDAIKILLKNGLNPNTPNYKGITPLSYAIVKRDLISIKLLLEYGANPINPDEFDTRPIDYAIFLNIQEVIELLNQYRQNNNVNNTVINQQNHNEHLLCTENLCNKIFKMFKSTLDFFVG